MSTVELTDWLREFAMLDCPMIGNPELAEKLLAAAEFIETAADAFKAADARIATLEAQIASDRAFDAAARHYGEEDIAQALEILQECMKMVIQHGAKGKRQ